MGRVMGFEPMHIGTTIRGLDHLTIPAMLFLLFNFNLFMWFLYIGTVISMWRGLDHLTPSPKTIHRIVLLGRVRHAVFVIQF